MGRCSDGLDSVITELIVGYMLPGRPVAMMIFKTFGYISEFVGVGRWMGADDIAL